MSRESECWTDGGWELRGLTPLECMVKTEPRGQNLGNRGKENQGLSSNHESPSALSSRLMGIHLERLSSLVILLQILTHPVELTALPPRARDIIPLDRDTASGPTYMSKAGFPSRGPEWPQITCLQTTNARGCGQKGTLLYHSVECS